MATSAEGKPKSERSLFDLVKRLNLFEQGVKRMVFETYLKLEPLVDLKMFLLLEDESGSRRVAGTQQFVEDFFEDGIRCKEGDLEIVLDAKKRSLVEVRKDDTHALRSPQLSPASSRPKKRRGDLEGEG